MFIINQPRYLLQNVLTQREQKQFANKNDVILMYSQLHNQVLNYK